MVAIRAVALTILALPGLCSASPWKTVTLADSAINGFTIGDSVDVMKQALGEPQRQMRAKLATNDFEHLEVHYEGILIKFSLHGRSAMRYAVSSRDYRLRSGIGVGSSRAELLEAFGPAYVNFSNGPESWSYDVANSEGASLFATLRFTFEGDAVARFSVTSR